MRNAKSIAPSAVWTPIAPAAKVKIHHGKGKSPLRVSLHDGKQRLSVFWDQAGNTPLIVNDTCHHRGASLSHGTVGDGCVTCLYHGHPTKARKRDTLLKDGIVWYDDKTFASTDTTVHSSWEFDDGQRVCIYERDFEGCNALYLQENTLDWAHLSHIHAFSFTKGEPEVVIHPDGKTASYVYETTIPDTVLIVENQFWSTSTCLRFRFGSKHGSSEREQWFSLHFAFIPIGRSHTRIIVRVTRRKLTWLGPIGDAALILSNELPLIEDRDIVRSIAPDRTWADDHLCDEDVFLRLFRAYIAETAPKMAQYYAAHEIPTNDV